MSVDREAQDDELLALASIYDEDEFHRAESTQGGEIRLCLELPPDFKVVVKGVGGTSHIDTHRANPRHSASTSIPVFCRREAN